MNRTVVRVLAGVVILGALAIAIAAVPSSSERSGAMKWAASLTTGERQQWATTERLTLLPRDYRKGVYLTLTTAEQRCAFWRNVFDTYRRTHTLSPEQRAALSDAESLLTPGLFRGVLGGANAFKVAQARLRVSSALGAEGEQQLFMTAGREVRSMAALPAPERMRHFWRANQPRRLVAWMEYVVPSLQALTCNCLYQSDCSYEMTCGNPVSCDVSSWG